MLSKPKILIFTHTPSPYQVEFFDAIAANRHLSITVGYLHSNAIGRNWALPSIAHNHFFGDKNFQSYTLAQTSIDANDLVIFNYYQDPFLLKLMKYCAEKGKYWCFWGERPGYRQLAQLGVYYRKWKLAVLHRQNVPIWGIGTWAVEQYRQEFGCDRQYFNLPYFSQLERFSPTQNHHAVDKVRHFLYSGSLIYRKGVDLLADAFIKLAAEEPNISLDIMGEGDLQTSLAKRLEKHKDKVRFLGFQAWENLQQFYQQAHILCVPSRYDGWGLVVPEGLSAGLPVIGTNRTGAALEFIKTDENGWLIPANDSKALYFAMKKATQLTTSELRLRSQLAQKSVADHALANGVIRFQQCVQDTLATFA